ncbi:helix-turn-helix domain-containing protein [Candidatus Woesebacteria bacterium]|nr:helix-turn-helix domain-containing protein [Candidatus Woesebacteria bacterium]
MLSTNQLPKTYTPEEVASILQLSKNTVYDLIAKGEIIAKKIGKVYRISRPSLSFADTGLDYDLLMAEQEDKKYASDINNALQKARKEL